MTLEELVHKRFLESRGISSQLARFNNAPAVFYQYAPGDTAPGWEGKHHYPRIDYVLDMQFSPERQSSGLMTVNIWCDDTQTEPENIEMEVRSVFRDLFIQPTGHVPFCLAWVRSDVFEYTIPRKDSMMYGMTVVFDVLAFPCHETSDPDPVLAMNRFIKDYCPQALVIGSDTIQEFFTAGANKPAFYFRLLTISLAKETNTVAWVDAEIAGHVFAPTAGDRIRWLRSFHDILALQGEVRMLDSSPMFLRGVKLDSRADYLMTGQLLLQVHFGLLRRHPWVHKLNNAYIR